MKINLPLFNVGNEPAKFALYVRLKYGDVLEWTSTLVYSPASYDDFLNAGKFLTYLHILRDRY